MISKIDVMHDIDCIHDYIDDYFDFCCLNGDKLITHIIQ